MFSIPTFQTEFTTDDTNNVGENIEFSSVGVTYGYSL